jgi:hypothetical protein
MICRLLLLLIYCLSSMLCCPLWMLAGGCRSMKRFLASPPGIELNYSRLDYTV